MLQRGDLVPHFTVTTVGGRIVQYSTLWQRRNLVLITLPASDPDRCRAYVSHLDGELRALRGLESECVVTRDVVSGVPCPGLIVADRWGEIVHVAAPSAVTDLPPASELIEWLTYVQNQCPECQGEAK